MLNGQLRPDAGSITFASRPITGLPPRAIWRLGVGRTFQITATFLSMTVLENVQTALLSFHGRLRSFRPWSSRLYLDEAFALLELVGMADQADRLCSVLAYGDLKRVELAIALANAPKLLLMDEPTAGMAPGERIELMRLASRDRARATHRHPVHRARHGRGLRPCRPGDGARPRPADRRRHAAAGAQRRPGARHVPRGREGSPPAADRP